MSTSSHPTASVCFIGYKRIPLNFSDSAPHVTYISSGRLTQVHDDWTSIVPIMFRLERGNGRRTDSFLPRNQNGDDLESAAVRHKFMLPSVEIRSGYTTLTTSAVCFISSSLIGWLSVGSWLAVCLLGCHLSVC